MKRKVLSLSVILCLMFGFGACAMFKKESTMDQRYLAAVSFFNDIVEDYLNAYDNASPAAKAKWKEKIDPIIKKGNLALNSWKLFLGTDEASNKEADFRAIKSELIQALLNLGIIEIKEG